MGTAHPAMPPVIAPPRKVVVGARSHAELIAKLSTLRPAIAWRGAAHTEVSQADLDWADAYVGFRRPPTPSWGNVRWIHCTGAGVDAFIYQQSLPDTIVLTRTSEPFGPQIAEFCVARALAHTQDLRRFERQQRASLWKQHDVTTLADSAVVVVGTGEVGTAVAERFIAMGCRVSGVSRSGQAKPPFDRVVATDTLAEAVSSARFVILTTPLTQATAGLFNRAVMSHCRGAFLINVGRGQLVEETSLGEALEAGWLSGAALDVFEVEPLPQSSPLWSDDRVFVSPHVAGLTTLDGAVTSLMDAIERIERGDVPSGVVDRGRGY